MKDAGSNPQLYDGEDGKLTMAVFDLFDYMREHVPITADNVDAFEKGSQRYLDKIEKMFQEYWENLTPRERETIGSSVAKMIDRFTTGTRGLIAEARRQHRLNRGWDAKHI